MRPTIIAPLLGLALGTVACPIFCSNSPTVQHTRFKYCIHRYEVYPEMITDPFVSPRLRNWDIVPNTKGSDDQIMASRGSYGAYLSTFFPVTKDEAMTATQSWRGRSNERTSWFIHIYSSSLSYILSHLTQVVDPIFLTLVFISFALFLAAYFIPERAEDEDDSTVSRRISLRSRRDRWQFDVKYKSSEDGLEDNPITRGDRYS